MSSNTKVAIVTGAGIGRQTALAFLQGGYSVALAVTCPLLLYHLLS
jgi:NAD(P)-dependent dehydrogenase (short-subunit alcohol dehydrogenase family)